MPGPISFRPTPAERDGLQRLASLTGGKVSDVLRDLIRDQLSELARERVLIDALAERWNRLTIDLQWTGGEPLPAIVGVEPRTADGPPLDEIAAVEARRVGVQTVVELVGRGEFAGCRAVMVVAPAGRRVKFEVIPAELTPAMEQVT